MMYLMIFIFKKKDVENLLRNLTLISKNRRFHQCGNYNKYFFILISKSRRFHQLRKFNKKMTLISKNRKFH